MITIDAAEALDGYRLRITFSDGAIKELDLGELIGSARGVFSSLRDPAIFKQVRVNPETRTVEWPWCPRTRKGEGETSSVSERPCPGAEEAPFLLIDLDTEVLYGFFEPASGVRITRRTIREPVRL
jgi:hypothetical protein